MTRLPLPNLFLTDPVRSICLTFTSMKHPNIQKANTLYFSAEFAKRYRIRAYRINCSYCYVSVCFNIKVSTFHIQIRILTSELVFTWELSFIKLTYICITIESLLDFNQEAGAFVNYCKYKMAFPPTNILDLRVCIKIFAHKI